MPNNEKIKHEEFMRIALELAVHGNPTPNPYVGCVIVKNDKIISEGYHKKCGEAHAEINTLSALKNKLKKDYIQQLNGSTFYITLEPCTHYGRTPPCIDEIIKAKPKEVVIAMLDPNPIVKGKGIKKLKEAGIKVNVGVLEEEARELNKFYIKYITTKMPYVIMKSAVTKNWKISWGDGKNKQISCEESNIFVHELRNKVDAILVGVNTVLRDNPLLTTRLNCLDIQTKPKDMKTQTKQKGMETSINSNMETQTKSSNMKTQTKNPLRVILDSRLSIPIDANVLNDNNVIIFAGKHAQHNKKMIEKKELLRKKGVKVFVCRDEKINIKKAIYALGKMGVISVLIEGGARVNTSAVKAKIVDEIYFIVAPFEIKDANSLYVFAGINNMSELFRFKKISINKLGKDFAVYVVPDYS